MDWKLMLGILGTICGVALFCVASALKVLDAATQALNDAKADWDKAVADLKKAYEETKTERQNLLKQSSQVGVFHNELKRKADGMKLDTMVAMDAVNREYRAKAALEAALRKYGATDADIDAAMRQIEEKN